MMNEHSDSRLTPDIGAIESNSPLRRPPSDYFPAGGARWFVIPDGRDAGKKQFYFDHCTAPGEAEATVVFVHGNPESSYTYRHIRDALSASSRPLRLVAMDHIGFGLSDQASFEMVDVHHANLLGMIPCRAMSYFSGTPPPRA